MPAAADGGWLGGRGQYEPSTEFDREGADGDKGRYMWQTGNPNPEDRVYFNAFVMQNNPTFLVAGRPYPADAQLDGGSMHFEYHRDAALLGVWRDCNSDGTIGNKLLPAVSYAAWTQYPHDLFSEDEITAMSQICPAGTAFNDGTYFNEFRAIGPGARFDPDEDKAGSMTVSGNQVLDEGDYNCDPAGRFDGDANRSKITGNVVNPCRNQFTTTTGSVHDINDEGARMWLDLGLPGDPHAPSRSVLFSRGQLDNSSRTMEHVEFVTGAHHHRRAMDRFIEEYDLPVPDEAKPGTVWDTIPNVGECDEDGELGGGPTNTCGLYPLQQARRVYNDSTHRDEPSTPLVSVFDSENDCRENRVFLFEDVEVADGVTIRGTIYHKDVSLGVNPNPLMEGSIAGTWENFRDGFDNVNNTHEGECGDGGSWGHLEVSSSTSAAKVAPNMRLIFQSNRHYQGAEAAGYPNFPVNTGGAGFGGYWIGTGGWIDRTGGMVITGSHQHRTYYAFVSDEAFEEIAGGAEGALPGGTVNLARYGTDVCGTDNFGSDAGIIRNWNCDRKAWEEYAYESDGDDALETWPRVGDYFNLRDVDCLSGGTGQTNPVTGDEIRPSIAPSCDGI